MKRSEELALELEAQKEADRKLKDEFKEMYGAEWWNDNVAWNEYYERWLVIDNVQKDLKFQIRREKNREIEVGDGVTMCYYSDRHACTVIARTKTTLTVQRDKAILDPNFKPEWIPGGFAGHCTNADEQSYTYEIDPNGAIYKCNWSEKNGRFQHGSDGSIKVKRGRHEYYDYNF